MPKQVKIEVIEVVSGKSLYINDFRVSGPKPWGGGVVIESFTIDKTELKKALSN